MKEKKYELSECISTFSKLLKGFVMSLFRGTYADFFVNCILFPNRTVLREFFPGGIDSAGLRDQLWRKRIKSFEIFLIQQSSISLNLSMKRKDM